MSGNKRFNSLPERRMSSESGIDWRGRKEVRTKGQEKEPGRAHTSASLSFPLRLLGNISSATWTPGQLERSQFNIYLTSLRHLDVTARFREQESNKKHARTAPVSNTTKRTPTSLHTPTQPRVSRSFGLIDSCTDQFCFSGGTCVTTSPYLSRV